ncbi:unnamed protein product [Discula destructiva]
MHAIPASVSILAMAAAVSAKVFPRAGTTTNGTVVAANFDGYCYYPNPDASFDVTTYGGTWYQVAGYDAIFTSGCKCITAEYTLNENGTVGVANECQLDGIAIPITITGSATAVDAAYGSVGVFDVVLNGAGSVCPGPNYIVQEYVEGDYAIVQSPDWSTLFILSREQNVTDTKLDTLITRAVALGSLESLIIIDDQSGCRYT